MDFVTVMGIAKRYANHERKVNPGKGLGDWHRQAFSLIAFCDKQDFETAQRELLAWAEHHSEQTDTKEEDTVVHNLGCGQPGSCKGEENGSKRTKVHELLGVEPNEPVDLVYVRQDGTENTHYHNVVFDENGYPSLQSGEALSMFSFADVINGALKVRRRPTYTPEQVKTMRALVELGAKFVTARQDEDAYLYAFNKMPTKCINNWEHASGGYTITTGERLECLRSLISDWTVPLDLLAALRDAGEEIV